jgi:aldose 1-epimerase
MASAAGTTRGSERPVSPTPSGEQFELRHGDQRAVIAEVGATLRTYSVGERDVLDGFASADRADGGRGQVLMPWPNRLRDGRYEWEGETHQLPLSEPELGNAIHGLVRWRNWSALDLSPSRATFGLRLFPTPGYPFTLGLTIDYELDDGGLRVCARAENLGGGACPFGVGFHPYLSIGGSIDHATLTLPATSTMTLDERQLPVSQEPVSGTPLDFRAGGVIGDTVLDTCFCELERDGDGRVRATLAGEEASVTLWMGEAFEYAMVYSGDTLAPARRRHGLAVEPMSCAPNAFQSGSGLVRLEPGATHVAEWGIEP